MIIGKNPDTKEELNSISEKKIKKKEHRHQYYFDNQEKEKIRKRKQYRENREKILAKTKEYYLKNKVKRKEYRHQYYLDNREKSKIQNRKLYIKNKEKILVQTKEYYLKNKDKMDEYKKCWKDTNSLKVKHTRKIWVKNNKDKVNSYTQKYRQTHKEAVKKVSRNFYSRHREQLIQKKVKYESERIKVDNNFMIKKRLRRLLSLALAKYNKSGKTMSSRKYGIDYNACINKLLPLPFPIEERKYWHIDHIKPLSSFNLNNLEEIELAFSPNNLQWLPAIENIIKGARMEESLCQN